MSTANSAMTQANFGEIPDLSYLNRSERAKLGTMLSVEPTIDTLTIAINNLIKNKNDQKYIEIINSIPIQPDSFQYLFIDRC